MRRSTALLCALTFGLASTGDAGERELPAGAIARLGLPRPAEAVFLFPDGKSLLAWESSPDGPGKLRLWDIPRQQALQAVAWPKSVLPTLLVSPDVGWLALGDGKNVQLWEAKSRKVRELSGTRPLAFSADSCHLITRSNTHVQTWDVNTAKQAGQYPLPGNFVALLPDGKTMVTFANNSTVQLGDLATGKLRHTFPVSAPDKLTFRGAMQAPRLEAIELAPGGKTLKTVHSWHLSEPRSSPGVITYLHQTWNIPSGKLASSWPGRAKEGDLFGVVQKQWMPKRPDFIPGGMKFKTDGKVALLVDSQTDAAQQRFEGHQGRIVAHSFSADGRFLATSSIDSTILIWKLVPRPTSRE